MREHSDRDLLCHVLAAEEVVQIFYSICILDRLSAVLKALIVAYMSKMMHSQTLGLQVQ